MAELRQGGEGRCNGDCAIITERVTVETEIFEGVQCGERSQKGHDSGCSESHAAQAQRRQTPEAGQRSRNCSDAAIAESVAAQVQELEVHGRREGPCGKRARVVLPEAARREYEGRRARQDDDTGVDDGPHSCWTAAPCCDDDCRRRDVLPEGAQGRKDAVNAGLR